MRISVLLASVLISVSAQAAPDLTNDDMGRFMNDRGLFSRIEQVRHSVAEKASNLVATSLGFLGVPYRRGGESAEAGFDCSGFVKAVYEQTIGLVLPRRAEQQAAATQTIGRDDLQPGDLVFFNTLRRAFSHVGIYVGDGKFIHSPKPGAQVRVESLGVSYWSRRFDGARRVLDESTTVASERTHQMFEKLSARMDSDRPSNAPLRTVAAAPRP